VFMKSTRTAPNLLVNHRRRGLIIIRYRDTLHHTPTDGLRPQSRRQNAPNVGP
jgi:hypothetical protein